MSIKPLLSKLRTEQQNVASTDLDTLSALEIARVINAEDQQIAPAVERALPQIARAMDAIANALADGGRLIYVGAGTSGRVAALDASEIPPTFDTNPRTVQYVIAGGDKALAEAIEANEDSRALGRRDLMRKRPTKKDVVVGIAASGRTPYTIAAVEYARAHGARTVAVTCNAGSPLAKAAQLAIVTDVGPEVVTGSTRLKAGTAQKMVLNMISTGAMARLGFVYGNWMAKVHFGNQKLVERGLTVLHALTGLNQARAAQLLHDARTLPVAVVMHLARVNRDEALRRLQRARGNLRQAVDEKRDQGKKKKSRS